MKENVRNEREKNVNGKCYFYELSQPKNITSPLGPILLTNLVS